MQSPQTNLALARLIIPFASFVTPFLGSSINVALPALANEFRLDPVTSGWFTTSYFLAAAMFMLQAARLGDIYGRRKIYVAGLLLIALSSFCMLLASSATELLVLRFIQGIGGALIFGTSHAIMVSIFPPELRGRALGLNVTAIYLGMTCGPFLGGFLTHHYGWRALFVLAGGASLAAVLLFKRFIHGEWRDAAGEKFDWLGGLLVAIALAALLIGSGRLPHSGSLLLILVVLISGAAFLRQQSRSRSPLLELTLFTQNRGVATAAGSAFLMYCGTFGVGFLLSLYLQYGRHMNPQQAGLILMAQPVAQVLCAGYAGRLSDRVDPRWLTSIGLLCCASGIALTMFISAEGSLVLVLAGMALNGVGIAGYSAPNTHAAMSAVDKRQLGVTGGILQTSRLCGQMISLGIPIMLFSLLLGQQGNLSETNPDKLLQTLYIAFTVFCVLNLLAAAVSWMRPNTLRSVATVPVNS